MRRRRSRRSWRIWPVGWLSSRLEAPQRWRWTKSTVWRIVWTPPGLRWRSGYAALSACTGWPCAQGRNFFSFCFSSHHHSWLNVCPPERGLEECYRHIDRQPLMTISINAGLDAGLIVNQVGCYSCVYHLCLLLLTATTTLPGSRVHWCQHGFRRCQRGDSRHDLCWHHRPCQGNACLPSITSVPKWVRFNRPRSVLRTFLLF